jgi:putative FmdB family regulatory protein
MAATLTSFRCMMCGNEYQEMADPEEDRERSCPRCRSNSIRQLTKARPEAHR